MRRELGFLIAPGRAIATQSAGTPLLSRTQPSRAPSILQNYARRPRYCILDEANRTAALFEDRLERAVNAGRPWDFLAFDRFQDIRGLEQLHLRTGLAGIAQVSVLPQLRRASWRCDVPFWHGRSIGWWFPWTPAAIGRVDEMEYWLWNQVCSAQLHPLPWHASRFKYVRNLFTPRFEHAKPPRAVSLSTSAIFNLSSALKSALQLPELCTMAGVLHALDALPGAPRGKLILSGRDGPWLSQIAQRWDVKRWLSRFETIFIEAKDVHVEGFETYPKGLTASYQGGERMQRLLHAIKQGRIRRSRKRHVLAAWGQRGNWGTNVTLDAQEADRFVESWHTRASDWRVDRRAIAAEQYFGELAKYRFLLAPRGNGIQAPKFLEALLVGTIPITRSYAAFSDLVDYGFPMVVVDDWQEITPEALERWWKALSPRLTAARWLATVEGVDSLLFGSCSEPASSSTSCHCSLTHMGLKYLAASAKCNALCDRRLARIVQQIKAEKKMQLAKRGAPRITQQCKEAGLTPFGLLGNSSSTNVVHASSRSPPI